MDQNECRNYRNLVSQYFRRTHILVLLRTPHQIPVLVQNLIVIETWKANAFPLLSARVSEAGSLKCYILLYHEAMLVNLLECALYTDGAVESLFASECSANHFAYAGGWQSEPSAVRMLAPWYGMDAAIESILHSLVEWTSFCGFVTLYRHSVASVICVCSEALLELIDYCFRKVTLMNIGRFNAFIDDSAAVDLLKETAEQTLQRQACEVGFRTAVSAFDALRFLTDHLKRMPLSAQVRHPECCGGGGGDRLACNLIRT